MLPPFPRKYSTGVEGMQDKRKRENGGSTEKRLYAIQPLQLVKKHACGGFFDDFCTVCLGAYGSPGGKRR